MLVQADEFVYFCTAMRLFGRIAYWLVAIAIVAAILVSLDYSLVRAILISLLFCPCALVLEFLMPKAKRPMDKVYLSLAVLTAVLLLIIVLHEFFWAKLSPDGYFIQGAPVAPMLINPAFLGIILIVLSIGDYFWAAWMDRKFKAKDRTVTFFSDRKSVSIRLADIDYVESNDTEVRIVSASGESYRNKTGIGQWENLLGDGFLRIHRSYLVNISRARFTAPDTVTVGEVQLPVSRKYKESVQLILSGTID